MSIRATTPRLMPDTGPTAEYRYAHDLVTAAVTNPIVGSDVRYNDACRLAQEHLKDTTALQLAECLAASYALGWPGNRPTKLALAVDWMLRDTILRDLQRRLKDDRQRYGDQTQDKVSEDHRWYDAD